MSSGFKGDDYQRIRLARTRMVFPDHDLVGGGVPTFVGQVTSTGSKLAVGRFLLVRPTEVLGAEVEGGVGSITPGTSTTVPVYLLGPGIPTTGDYLVCRYVDNRWVAERTVSGKRTGDIGTIPDCACTEIPATLRMTSADPKCNYQMFQSCTIQYGPTPAPFTSNNLGSKIFLSTESFYDPVAGGSRFYYYLTCLYNQFSLTRLYAESPYGSPYRDAVLYTWLTGGYGNTCKPFHLDNGRAFPGSDLSCSVTIDQA